jgi:hypothetical protein
MTYWDNESKRSQDAHITTWLVIMMKLLKPFLKNNCSISNIIVYLLFKNEIKPMKPSAIHIMDENTIFMDEKIKIKIKG